MTEMGNEVKDLFYRFGFDFLMVMDMYRYAAEEGITISDVIQIFKDGNVDPKSVAWISYNGYQSFKNLISELKGG